jgi:hypothetical protein
VGMDGIGAMEAWPSPRAAADSFVILMTLVAKGEVVHGALGGCHRPQCPIQGIGLLAWEVSTLPATTAAG